MAKSEKKHPTADTFRRVRLFVTIGRVAILIALILWLVYMMNQF